MSESGFPGRSISPPYIQLSNNCPPKCLHPYSRTCECIAFHGKEELEVHMELRLLIDDLQKIILGYPGGSPIIIRVLTCGWRRHKSMSKKCQQMFRSQVSASINQSKVSGKTGFEDERGSWGKEQGSPWKLEKARKVTFSPKATRKEHSETLY